MRVFIICVCVVAVLIGLVTVNSILVRGIADELIQCVEALDTSSQNYDKLVQLWDKNCSFISLTSSTKETDKIEQESLCAGSVKEDVKSQEQGICNAQGSKDLSYAVLSECECLLS